MEIKNQHSIRTLRLKGRRSADPDAEILLECIARSTPFRLLSRALSRHYATFVKGFIADKDPARRH